MDLYALDEEIFALETKLSLLESTPRLAVLIPLAWYLRQRNCQRALALGEEARELLQHARNDDTWYRRNLARIGLIHGEVHWLNGELESAEQCAMDALKEFEQINDLLAVGDSFFLLTSIYRDFGQIKKRDQYLRMAIENYGFGGDIERQQIALARSLHNGAIRDPKFTAAEIYRHFNVTEIYPNTVLAWLASAKAIVCNKIGDMGESCRLHIQAHRAAYESGQIRQAILAATNAGDSFATLGDLDAALEWDEIALATARSNHWPSSLATALLQTGNALRLLERYDDAKEKLVESLNIQKKIPGSRTFAHTLCYLGDLSLDLNLPNEALGFFEVAAEKIIEHKEPIFLSDCWRGQAIAYCRLGDYPKTSDKIHAALEVARQHENIDEQIKCLRVLAELSRNYLHSPTEIVTAPNLALHYLLQALTLCTSIRGITVPADLLDEIANNYAQLSDFESAYQFSKRAAQAKEDRRLNEARNRATAMQVRYDNERHRADAEHHRRIAQAEATRATSLQESSNTLETLGLIGREITANLNVDTVFEALHKHVNELLEANSFGICLLEPNGQELQLAFGMENGVPLEHFKTTIDHPVSAFARCAREREEIVIERESGSQDHYVVPGTIETLSLLYMPLLIGERLLGAMSIQSIHAHQYGERERSILRTLAAYGAIALDNASAYKQLQATLTTLRETQNQLEEVSITDPLTGLRNRRFLLQHIEADVARVLRAYDDHLQTPQEHNPSDEDMVFFMVDIDHFKSINDTYGHACGDLVLVQMRHRLQSVFRESDYLIRWGGEEFLVVARTCNRKDAPLVAERIRKTIASTPFLLTNEVETSRTCSVGYASFPFLPHQPHLLTWAQVVNFADQGLYMVKKSGRNACIGIAHTAERQSEEFYNRVMRQPHHAANAGSIQILSQKVQQMDDVISAS